MDGQTFEKFIASRPNRPDRKRTKIYVQPLGDITVEPMRDFAADFFAMPVQALAAIDISAERITSRGKQLLTTDLLALLKRRLPADAYCLIAATKADLYPDPSWNFVFGQASMRERVGVFSVARFADPDPDVVFRRICKVLAHETCHMFGIAHCLFEPCLMNRSNNLEECDARPMDLCAVDRKKLAWSLGHHVMPLAMR